MKRTMLGTMLVATAVVSLLAGCNFKPTEPVTADGKVLSVLVVDANDAEELAAATEVEAARVNYRFRLEVLKSYYRKVGDIDKFEWATDEMKNLRTAQTFAWQGLPEIVPPKGVSLEDADERLLVEYTVAARRKYVRAVAELLEFYERKMPAAYKTARIRNMQLRLFPERTYMYFKAAEVPPASLKPVDHLSEANALYKKALKLHEEGKGFLRCGLTTNYGKQREALAMFLRLVDRHPRSTKIALSAYHIAEIYKEYFNRNLRAVAWYERAWQWDPKILKPARFQAATVYDLRLGEKSKAVELYKQAIEQEQFNTSNVTWARRRIRELTGK